MNKLALESRLNGTLRLKPLDDEAIPRIILLWESVSIVTPEMEDCSIRIKKGKAMKFIRARIRTTTNGTNTRNYRTGVQSHH